MAQPIDIRTRRPLGGEPPEPTYPPEWYDVAAVRLAIMRICPAAARDLLGNAAITGLAQAAVRTLDQTRQARAADPTADRRSAAHDWVGGLAAAYGWGTGPSANVTPPEAGPPSNSIRGEYDALKEMIEGRDPLSEPPGPVPA